MTATTKATVAERLKDEHPSASGMLSKLIYTSILALLTIENPTTSHDAGDALEKFIDALGATTDMPRAFIESERPASDDTRPLYQRIDDEADGVRRSWRALLGMFNQVEAYLSPLTFDDYRAALEGLFVAFGLPTSRAQLEANPEAYPNVGRKEA